MKETISFTNFCISDTGFTCTVESSKMGKTDELSYMLNPIDDIKLCLDKDSIAYALSTLCGKAYADIFIDLQISYQCCAQIANFTGAVVKTAEYDVPPNVLPANTKIEIDNQAYDIRNPEEGVILTFSGGFDSLAALALLSDVVGLHLVSIDFGGSFDRETAFFSKFPTNIVQTNFRQLNYNRENPNFMGTGAILFAKMFNAKYHVYGTIMEASQWSFHKRRRQPVTPPLSYVGLNDWYVVKGLTEVATVMIVTYYYPNKVNASLKSLGPAGSEKLWRKYLLGTIICDRYDRDIDFDKPPFPNKVAVKPFGQVFARDFLALYELKYTSREAVEKTFCEIPQEVDDFVDGHSLEFYEKLNTNFLYTLPPTVRDDVLQKLAAAGVLPYTDKDWEEFEEVKKFLGKWYPILLD